MGPSDRPVVGIDPECEEARKLIDYGLAELVDGEVVLNDRTMGAIVARTPDPLLYVRAILRMFESTRESIDNLAADFVHALEELYTARFGAAHVPKPEEMAELSRIVLDYRDLGDKVIANRLDEAMREQMVTTVSEFTAAILLSGDWQSSAQSSGYTRVVAGSPPKRCASHTGMIATIVSAAATTLITGAWLGRNRFPKIQIGSV